MSDSLRPLKVVIIKAEIKSLDNSSYNAISPCQGGGVHYHGERAFMPATTNMGFRV